MSTMDPLVFILTCLSGFIIVILAEPPFDNCVCQGNVLSCKRRYTNYYGYRFGRNNAQRDDSLRTTQGHLDPNRAPYIDIKGICPNATEVQLENLNFREFPDGLAENITKIDVANNLLTALPSAAKLSRNVRYLDFSANQIETPPDERLRALSELEELRLGWNRVRHLRFLPSPCGLRRLDVTVNFVSSLEGSVGRCGRLEAFRVLANNVTALPDGVFANLSQLQDLTLSKNPIESLAPRSFEGLTRLDTLRLDGTLITTLQNRAFASLQNLQQLVLSDNVFISLSEGSFDGIPQLHTLYLNNALRNISVLPENIFSKLNNLEVLILDDNDLNSLPNNLFRGLTQLKALHLQSNRLRHIPDNAFASLGNLKLLRLDHNQLRALQPGLLSPLASLRELQAAYNQLTSLPELSSCCAPLRSASFWNNSVTAPTEARLRALLGAGGAQQREVDLRENPLRASALRWTLRARDVEAFADGGGCECGGLRKGSAVLRFCVSAPCGRHAPFADWRMAVAAANDGGR